jgi:hypothetical protein
VVLSIVSQYFLKDDLPQKGSGVTKACGFDNSIARYGPHWIGEYLSQYVTKDTSYSFAEQGTSDSAEANSLIFSEV